MQLTHTAVGQRGPVYFSRLSGRKYGFTTTTKKEQLVYSLIFGLVLDKLGGFS